MKKPRILTIDIETLPLELYGWGLHEQNFGLDQIKTDWSIAVACAKFLDEDHVRVFSTQGRKDIRDDKLLVKELQKLYAEADVIVGQNHVRFDSKKINARAKIHGLPPTAEKYHIDTVKIAKKSFGFTSNKLAYLTKDSSEKKSTHGSFPGFSLWAEVMKGNPAAWDEMVEYCKQDVIATEKLAQELIPWDGTLDLRNLSPQTVFSCRVCGSTNLRKDGYVTRKTGKYQTYSCGDCGCTTRETSPDLTKQQRAANKKLLTNARTGFRLKVRR